MHAAAARVVRSVLPSPLAAPWTASWRHAAHHHHHRPLHSQTSFSSGGARVSAGRLMHMPSFVSRRLFTTQAATATATAATATAAKGASRAVARAVAVAAMGGGAVAAVLAAQYLGYELEDAKRLVGLGTDDLTAEEEKELAELAEASALVTKVAPTDFQHPYNSAPLLWRVWFTVRRGFFLVWVFLPVAFLSLRINLFGSTPELRARWLLLLRRALERSGAAMIKFGQWISMRPDHFPPDLCHCLAHLRDAVPAHPFAATREMLRVDLQGELETVFELFASEPVASGSVAQVYHAVLREEYALATGQREVAVKVRHPTVVDETFIDMDFIFRAIPLLLTALDLNIKLPFDRTEFALLLQQQIDLRWEALNLARLAHNFSREGTRTEGIKLRFPRVSPRLLSERILVESWANGTSIDHEFDRPEPPLPPLSLFDRLRDWALPPTIQKPRGLHYALAESIFDMYMKMFLRDNFLHGDLHAGNLLFDRKTNTVTVLDAGIATSVGTAVWYPFGDFIRAFCTGDETAMADSLTKFDSRPRPEEERLALAAQVKADLNARLKPWRDLGYPMSPGGDVVKGGEVLNVVVESLMLHKIVLRGDVASSLLTMSLAETLILSLWPSFDMLVNALPYFVRYQGWSSNDAVWNAGYSRDWRATQAALEAK